MIDKGDYLRVVGKIIWPASMTRPDIAHASSALCGCVSGPTEEHLKLAMNVIGDWMHTVLSSMMPDVHEFAAATLRGALSDDPVPCSESFVIRDSRDVVRRIRDLELRRRAAWTAWRDGRQGATRPIRPQKVQFEVADFTTLYPSMPHADIMRAIHAIVTRVFTSKVNESNGQPKFLVVVRGACLEPKFETSAAIA